MKERERDKEGEEERKREGWGGGGGGEMEVDLRRGEGGRGWWLSFSVYICFLLCLSLYTCSMYVSRCCFAAQSMYIYMYLLSNLLARQKLCPLLCI